jgi:hypothetical protein
VIRKLIVPPDKQIRELSRILNGWQAHCHAEQQTWPESKIKRNVRDSLEKLAPGLARLSQANQRNLENASRDDAPPAVLAILARRSLEIDATVKFVVKAKSFSAFADFVTIAGERWTSLAEALTEDFCSAIQPANPTVRFGIGHEGPLARFFVCVVPFLTGEHPTAESVATQLKALRMRGRSAIARIP